MAKKERKKYRMRDPSTNEVIEFDTIEKDIIQILAKRIGKLEIKAINKLVEEIELAKVLERSLTIKEQDIYYKSKFRLKQLLNEEVINVSKKEMSKDADMVGFKLEMLDDKNEKVKMDLKRTNTWDTRFLSVKLSVILEWCMKCSELFRKLKYFNDECEEDIDKDEIIEEIDNLVDNIKIQVNKMDIWFGFKDISHTYFRCLEELYNIPSMKDREVHQHLYDDMDLMDRYKELLYEI